MSSSTALHHVPQPLRAKIEALDERRASMQAFVSEIAAIQERLTLKQAVVEAVIDRRIQSHHELLDKWRERVRVRQGGARP